MTTATCSSFGSLIVIIAHNDATNEDISFVCDQRKSAEIEIGRLRSMEHISSVRAMDAVFKPAR